MTTPLMIPLKSFDKDYLEQKITELKERGYSCETEIKENKPRANHYHDGRIFYFVRMIKSNDNN